MVGMSQVSCLNNWSVRELSNSLIASLLCRGTHALADIGLGNVERVVARIVPRVRLAVSVNQKSVTQRQSSW